MKEKLYTTELNGDILTGVYSKLVTIINKSGLLGSKIILLSTPVNN